MPDITANVIVSMPSQIFTMARSFKAVANGKIFIGNIDTDPTIPGNQIPVYLENEDGSYVQIQQPISINAGGFPVYSGQVAKFVTVKGHSMAVYDAYGTQQFYYPNVLKYDPDQLRSELASTSGTGAIGLPTGGTLQEVVTPIDDVSKIITHSFHDGMSYRLAAWRPIVAPIANAYGGGEFYYSASTPRSSHNGGTVIDVTVPYNGDVAYLAGTGTAGGNGCLIRKGVSKDLHMSWFGAVPNTEDVISTASAQKCLDVAFESQTPAFVDFSIMTDKPLILNTRTTLRGVNKYKSFIFKLNNATSGLPDMLAPGDFGGGSDVSFSYDKDAVIIVKPEREKEYATWVRIEDISVENNVNPESGEMPETSFGIYAPVINLSQIINVQAYKVGFGLYSEVMWMTQVNQWRGFNLNHNIYVNSAGTSLVFQNVWVQGCYSTAYFWRNVGYFNFVQVSADGIHRPDATSLIYPYIFDGCIDGKANLSLEETHGCGFVQVASNGDIESNISITMFAATGIRQHTTTTPQPAIVVHSSKVTFENCDFKFHPDSTGNISPMFVHASNIVSINSPYFRDNPFGSDDNASKLVLLGNSVTLRGRSGGSSIETTIGDDFSLQGDWDRGGKIKFYGVSGTLYGTLFANSAGDIRWKSLGVPTSNSDGTKLN